MSLFRWLKAGASPASTPRSTPAPAAAEEPLDALPLAEQDFARAWQPAGRRLLVGAPRSLRQGRRVTVAVSGEGGALIPLSGTVAGPAPEGSVEVIVDADRLGAVQRILASLAGKAERPRPRPPRYRLALPAVVSSRAVHAYMTTFSVSQGGCGLLWSGPRPSRGTPLLVRLGSGGRSASFHARVAWASEDGGALRVGVRFVAEQEGALGPLLAEGRRGTAT